MSLYSVNYPYIYESQFQLLLLIQTLVLHKNIRKRLYDFSFSDVIAFCGLMIMQCLQCIKPTNSGEILRLCVWYDT